MRLLCDGDTREVEVVGRPDANFSIYFKDYASAAPDYDIRLVDLAADSVRFEIQGLRQTARFVHVGSDVHLQSGAMTVKVTDGTLVRDARAAADGDLRLLAPMNGRIVAVLAQAGEPVFKGQRIAVLEAMKMQHELTAQRDGTLAEVAVREGDQVAARQLVAALAPA